MMMKKLMNMNIRTYSELMKLQTFEERYEYLKLDGRVGEDTFGFDRYLNQRFYKTREWRSIRDYVIIRDGACDLGIEDMPVYDRIIIHHMNPITKQDILNKTDYLLNPEYLICVSKRTHDAIHYGTNEVYTGEIIERTKNDTCPWRR